MPPVQHTFGTTGNAPSHPGAGATQMPQSPNNNPYFSQSTPVPPPPPPPPGTFEVEAPRTSSIAPNPSVSPNPYSQNSYNTQNTYSQNPYNQYDSLPQPQEPIPAYTRYAQNESPDLLAARREFLDVDTQIQNETTELNHRLNNANEDPIIINSLQDSIRKLYLRKGALMQRIQDLQDPNSYAFQQSQAMTVNPTNQTPLMYDNEAQDRNRALTLANYTVTSRDRMKGVACIIILFVVLVIIIIGLVVKKRHS
ncbi:hypothetical protein TWF718_003000 [Orbilia javanica]|uniref:Uncharacterized protein n=1 Tax=Orbilia javanica TaxID=47235 RepID=A0AAN8RJA1_9PEZI